MQAELLTECVPELLLFPVLASTKLTVRAESGSAAFRQLLTAESAEPDDPDPGQDVSNLDENASSQQESLPSDPDSVMQRHASPG